MANKVVIGGLASILVVACVVAAAVTLTKKDESSDDGQVTTSTKSVEAMCQPTPYKATCEKTLNSAKDAKEPKDFIKVAFDATAKDFKDAIMNTDLIMKAASDDYTKEALHTCEELFDLAIEDLRRSVEQVDTFDLSKIKDIVDDLKTWLSAVITYEETCLDAFEKTEGDTGAKMVQLLNNTRELSSNALVMLTNFGDVLTQTTGLSRRKLLSTDEESQEAFVDASSRRLLQIGNAKPNVVVAQDGSGQYKTISEALKAVPQKNTVPFIIYIKAGIYKEYVNIPKGMTNVVFIGDGPTKTKVTGNKAVVKGTKLSTFHTCTVCVEGDFFVAKNIGFENTAGPTQEQAVALRVNADKVAIHNCQIDGYQDTLYAHSMRQFYRDCTVSGTIDFIFGNALSVFQNCKFIVRKPGPTQACMVTAQGRTKEIQTGAIVFQNCEIKPDADYFNLKPPAKTYLGRPWKEYSRTIIMQSFIDKFIEPEGWAPWNTTDFGRHTSFYAEFQNRGPGAAVDKRVNWKGIQKGFTAAAAQKFTVDACLNDEVNWLQKANVPYDGGMMKV